MPNIQVCISPDQRWPSTSRIVTNAACSPQLIDSDLAEPCLKCRKITEGIVDRSGQIIGDVGYQNQLVPQEYKI
jgi:hypothetical protein